MGIYRYTHTYNTIHSISFSPFANLRICVLKGLACRSRATAASSCVSPCSGEALTSPACGGASPLRARFWPIPYGKHIWYQRYTTTFILSNTINKVIHDRPPCKTKAITQAVSPAFHGRHKCILLGVIVGAVTLKRALITHMDLHTQTFMRSRCQ